MDFFDPILAFAVISTCALVVIAARVWQRRKSPGVDRLVKEKRYAEAARKASAAGNWIEAMDLYLLAGEIGEAAPMAVNAGRLKQAAELYEWAGDKASAAHYYAECGMDRRAEELRIVHGLRVPVVLPADDEVTPIGDIPCAQSGPKTVRERADALLAAGDVRGAAEELAAGGMIEDAEYLYVNVLGEPGRRSPTGTSPAESASAGKSALTPEKLALMVSQVARAAAKKIRDQSVNDHLFAYRPPEGVQAAFEEAALEAIHGLERYQLIGELGRGGMAVVYRAYDKHLQREVAMKFIMRGMTGADFDALFLREARAVAALNHPNIITIFDSDVLGGQMFICMEYVEGRTLSELLDEGRLTVAESLRIIKQVLDGLHYAHEKGIVHRDIKPANIMRTDDGRVKLMDFGIAKSASVSEQSSIIAGTPAYMSPERFRGGKIDRRTDVFAVGVTLYEMLTRKLPFEGMDRTRVPARVRALVPALPEILDEIVERAIALDPEERWSTAQAMARPIGKILAAISEYAAPAPRAPTTRRLQPR